MKSIPENTAGPQWSSKLLDDLVFIKKHLRYPFSKRTVPSLLLLTTFVIFVSRMLWLTIILRRNAPGYIWFAVVGIVILCIIMILYQYYGILKFRSIPTPFFTDDNRKLVKQFLGAQQLVTYTHPQAPEVFQIVSRPLNNSKNEQREIMIFIADDKRILVNSHFINQRFVLSTASGNAGQMANRLKEWLDRQHINTNTSIMR